MNPQTFQAELAAAERRLAAADPMLGGLIARHGPCRLAPDWTCSPYQALVRAVVYQQLHGKAAATILERMIALFPGVAFPSPDALLAASDDRLRSAGLSRQKTAALHDIARKTLDGIVPTNRLGLADAGDEELIQRLTQVRGVGRWTVEMLLIFTLGRLDVLPVDDYGVRNGYRKATGRDSLVPPRELLVRGAVWAPYRSVASWYFWREAGARAMDANPPAF